VTKLSDTSAEAERVLTQIYRGMTPGQKWHILGEAYHTAKVLHAAGVRLRQPGASALQIHESWLALTVPCTVPRPLRGPDMDQNQQNLRGLRDVLRVFDALAIPYAVSGSMASSLYGIPRFTRDADITAEPFPGKEAQLAAGFGDDYYLSLPAIQDALRRRSSFNIINTRTGFKVDVFLGKEAPFERSAMARRLALDLPDVPGEPLIVLAPEDVLLFKLRWYRLGNESSDQQWTDILGVLKAQAGKLDEAYLDHWAADLKVADLLARARQESASP
jgi:hypothetical protein